jgi:SAM-dependent methyltransferase
VGWVARRPPAPILRYAQDDGLSTIARIVHPMLRLQAQVWEEDSAALFDQIPVRPGWECVDVGCGAMGVLRPLSERVGEGGRVLGIDADESFVRAAELFIADNELTNVRVKQADIFSDGLPDEMFDLVHLRFMFAPYGRDDDLLARALTLLRPGGVLVVQEPDASSWNTMPPHPAFEELKSLILDTVRRGGGDFNAGQRVFRRLRRSGLQKVMARACVHALSGAHPYMRLPLQFAESLRDRILAANLIESEELDALMNTVDGIVSKPDTGLLTFILVQAWGWK